MLIKSLQSLQQNDLAFKNRQIESYFISTDHKRRLLMMRVKILSEKSR